VNRDARELQALSRVRIEEALTAVEEQYTAFLSAALERSRELVTQAEANVLTLAEKAQEALDTVATADDEADPDPGAMNAMDGIEDLPEGQGEAHHFIDSLHADIETETAEAELGDYVPSEGTDEDNYFSRLAAELRDDPDQHEYPRDRSPDDEEPVWAGAAGVGDALSPSGSGQQVAVLETATAEPSMPHRAFTQDAATRAVNLVAALPEIVTSANELGSDAGDGSVRLELSGASSEKDGCVSLRLTTYDEAGWWEYRDVIATADSEERASTVVDIGELRDALGTLNRFGGGSEAHILLEGNVTVGNHLLLARDPHRVPALSDDRKRIERIDLQGAQRSGLVLETQVGRLCVPPALLTYLKKRHATATELVTIDDMPCLSAQVNGSAGTPAGMIIARLQELGDDEIQTVAERRNTAGSEVTQLVSALSSATTGEELERILKVGVGYVRRKAAAHPALDPEVIDDLIREGTEAMRAAAASNVSIGEAASDLAVADASPVVRAVVAANPAITPIGLERLTADPVAQVRAHAASNPAIQSELLEQLAEDDDSSVRAAVASHEGIALETLLVLARDPDQSVCAAVASNLKCPADLLTELVSIVPHSVLANPHASKTLLTAGSVVNEPRLRATVAGNPATPAKRLRQLARDRDPNVLRAIADHPQAPPGARRRARRQLDDAETTTRTSTNTEL
jgi:hypothetical protein